MTSDGAVSYGPVRDDDDDVGNSSLGEPRQDAFDKSQNRFFRGEQGGLPTPISNVQSSPVLQPLEMTSHDTDSVEVIVDADDDAHEEHAVPWRGSIMQRLVSADHRLVSSALCVASCLPVLIWVSVVYELFGRSWICLPLALHLVLETGVACRNSFLFREWTVKNVRQAPICQRARRSCKSCCCSCLSHRSSFIVFAHSALDACLFSLVYPPVARGLQEAFFTEPDGTVATEWDGLYSEINNAVHLGQGVAVCRLALICMIVISLPLRIFMLGRGESSSFRSTNRNNDSSEKEPKWKKAQVSTSQDLAGDGRGSVKRLCKRVSLHSLYQVYLVLALICSVLFLVRCGLSMLIHIPKWDPPSPPKLGENIRYCDPLDLTECALPWPSSYHLAKDSSSETGWRVDLKGSTLPPLKGNIDVDPSFLNKLDGFSTMAPILFYVDGMKEAHDANVGDAKLQGVGSISKSMTSESVTLLLDVADRKLVPHIAELDHLNDDRPLIMVTPSQPLRHNRHYAVAVVNAVGVDGLPLPPTPGLTALLEFQERSGTTPLTSSHAERRHRFKTNVIPSLSDAAPWFDYESDHRTLQLLFDFHTASAATQLGPVRAVRDATLATIGSPEWGGWGDHNVRVTSVEEGNCEKSLFARKVHGELQVPWFLEDYGRGHRGAFLDEALVSDGKSTQTGGAKFFVIIPCSLKLGALDAMDGRELRAVVEYGHGLFASRDEASDGYLLRMANENGYVLMAMDWRGMSQYDFPIVIKTLMSTPRLFQAVRDNLIQGYANKLALQHFAQNGMLDCSWLSFDDGSGSRRSIRKMGGVQPASVFYGNSQGGILGGGYSALMGPTGLIDRSALGVPGTPFALIMTRSLDFSGYDIVMLLNFYHNRHVRIFLSVVQMAWDSVEGSGLLAAPVTEPFPRVLLQAGLGDPIVPTIAAEALSRAYNASTLPANPRQIFGLSTSTPADGTFAGPQATLTEALYEKEYNALPKENLQPRGNAARVHLCVRLDMDLQRQLVEFINTGRVVDPCERHHCIHTSSRSC